MEFRHLRPVDLAMPMHCTASELEDDLPFVSRPPTVPLGWAGACHTVLGSWASMRCSRSSGRAGNKSMPSSASRSSTRTKLASKLLDTWDWFGNRKAKQLVSGEVRKITFQKAAGTRTPDGNVPTELSLGPHVTCTSRWAKLQARTCSSNFFQTPRFNPGVCGAMFVIKKDACISACEVLESAAGFK